jgi:hypothetical protein
MRTRMLAAFVSAIVFLVASSASDHLTASPAREAFPNPLCDQDFPTASAPDPTATVVMCELQNPRGLTFNGSDLYVAEAGYGGLEGAPSFHGQAGGTRYFGLTGSVSRLADGEQERIASGFPSHAGLLGGSAIGPNDVAFVTPSAMAGIDAADHSFPCRAGCLFVAIGLQQPPTYRTTYPFLADFAKLARVTPSGSWSYIADIGTYEIEHDPDQSVAVSPKLDTNPYGLISEPSGHSLLVADAGGNSLLRVAAQGNAFAVGTFDISTAAVFAPHPDDAVPTSVVAGPDGAYYVGELTGFPPVAGAANVYRLPRSGEPPHVCVTGFTLIIDIAFDRAGNLYVLEYAGSLIRVAPGNNVSSESVSGTCARYAGGERTTIVTGLTNPTAIAVGPDDALYVSNRGTFRRGQVIRFDR